VTKVGFKPILAIGMVLIAAGLAWFSQISVHGSFVGDILGPSLLAAIGLGLAFVPLTIAAVSGIEDREQGLASGLINTSEQVGGALGLAILAAVANGIINGSRDPDVLTEGFQAAFLVGAAFAALGLAATLLLMRSSDSRAQVELSSPAAAGACSASSEAAAVACASSSATAMTAARQGAQAGSPARGGIATTSRISENGPQGGDGP
jgi:sugar phosphate permease